ncbi:MAG: hypothetical protein LBS62_07315 [Clostridiales bacterium]|nr:hypothetical protein [Clostridiales bacterium]
MKYLKTICGFANASGGILEIGRSDNGAVVGIAGARKLLEVLPNKLRNAMDIIGDVDIAEESCKQYIKVTVKPYPISCGGRYYYRWDSTTQELIFATHRSEPYKSNDYYDVFENWIPARSVEQARLSLQRFHSKFRAFRNFQTRLSTFFLAGMIESWGRGIEKITEACKKAGKPAPSIKFKYNREFSVTFYDSRAQLRRI